VHDLTPAPELLHGGETLVYADAGYQGITNRHEMEGKAIEFRVAMRPGQRRVLPETPEGKLLNLIETAKPHMRVKGEHSFRVNKQQFWLPKDQAQGHREEPLQGACVGGANESVVHACIEMVCLLGHAGCPWIWAASICWS
jgi:IS5 family transposase